MRRFVAVLAAGLGAVLGTSGVVHAGEAAIDPAGNFLVMDADISPPRAGTKKKPQPVTLDFHQMYGNYRSGAQPPRNRSLTVRLPRGMTSHPEFIGACALPKSDEDVKVDRCPASSRVGKGTAVADARSLGVNDPVSATIDAYSGEDNAAGNPTLILIAVAKVGGSDVVVEYDFESKNAGPAPYGISLVTFDPYPSPPPDPNSGFITLNKLDLKVRRNVTRTQKGKRVKRGYLEAPTTCPRAGWSFREEFEQIDAPTLMAPDVVACVK